MKKLGLKAKLVEQWQESINSGIMPVFEIQTGAGEWLLVELSFLDLKVNGGLFFSFDCEDKPKFFSGNVKKYRGGYLIPFSCHFDRLDHYLEKCYDEILEGYLIPNDLYYCENEA